MIKKISFVLALFALSLNVGCCTFFPWLSKCNRYCTFNAAPNTLFSVHYGDGTPDFIGRTDFNGVGRYPKGASGQCPPALVGSNAGLSLSASPSGIDLTAPPSLVILTPQGFDTTYGMPRIDYFDSTGFLLGSAVATAIAGDASWVQGPVPDLSQVYSGTYSVRVTNMAASGYYLNEVGSASITAWGRDRPDSDGDGWYDDEDCYPYDSTQWSCGGGGGGGGGDEGCGPYECNMY